MYKIVGRIGLKEKYGKKVEAVIEASKMPGCKIAIIDKISDDSLELQASEVLKPLSYEDSLRIVETVALNDKQILACFWQGETIYSKREKLAMKKQQQS